MANLAIIKTGGKQYTVTENQVLKIEKIIGDAGAKVKFEEVLLVSDEQGANLELGAPFIKGQAVEAEIVEQGRDRKINVIKYKRKTRYRRKQGHRQPFTRVKITKI